VLPAIATAKERIAVRANIRHIKVHDLAATMSEHDKDVQHFKRDRRYGKEVN
jgi:hypothetical protein